MAPMIFVLLLLALVTGVAQAQQATDAPTVTLAPVIVTATRSAQAGFDLPMSVDRVDGDRLRNGQLQVNLSESLAQVAGLSVQNRQNYAQDLQVSVRGFGARSSFGTRGIRLYSDGIPGTMPDGQGQFSQFDLGSAQRIEILRGPFSALYGNSSGGVIAIFTEDAPTSGLLSATASAGGLGQQRIAIKGGGQAGVLNYLLSASHFQTDGYRVHSQAERSNFNAHLRFQLSDRARLTVTGNAVETPFVQDPLGLTAAQLSDPTQAGTNALTYNTRKSLAQQQLGAQLEFAATPATDIAAMAYVGHRATTQFQSILASAEAAATHPGGVIDLARNYRGIDLHTVHRGQLGGAPLELTAGFSYDRLDEARKGYLNFIGTQLGVLGALRRDEANTFDNVDEYLQAQWDPTAKWRVLAGVRNSVVTGTSTNQLPTSGSPNSDVRYTATNPVIGATWRAADHLHVYGSYGRGFETPTLNELAYRSTDGSLPGWNLALRPSRSNHYELGAKVQQSRLSASLAVFDVTTRDELAVQSSAGGRSVYQNVGATERRGGELEVEAIVAEHFNARLAYTRLNAVVSQAYKTCVGLPCVQTTVAAGSQLPAVPGESLFAALTWRAPWWGLSATVETVRRTRIYANDTNSDYAGGYWTANLNVGSQQQGRGWRLSEYGRIDNLTNQRYVGSVIVNDSNGRFFEPEPGRTFYFMLTAARL